jgi:hypothetical protein
MESIFVEEDSIVSKWNNRIMRIIERLHRKEFVKLIENEFKEEASPNSKM